MPERMTLADSLEAEIERCQDLLCAYQSIPTGAFAAGRIRATLKRATRAMLAGDLVEMIRVHEELKTFE